MCYRHTYVRGGCTSIINLGRTSLEFTSTRMFGRDFLYFPRRVFPYICFPRFTWNSCIHVGVGDPWHTTPIRKLYVSVYLSPIPRWIMAEIIISQRFGRKVCAESVNLLCTLWVLFPTCVCVCMPCGEKESCCWRYVCCMCVCI